jgi:hypothetical protein
LLAICAGQAAADDTKLHQQPWQISLGTFTNESDWTIRADAEGNDGTEIDWGDTFGDVDGTKFRLDSYWRINDRITFVSCTPQILRSNAGIRSRYRLEWRNHSSRCFCPIRIGFEIIELAYEYDSKREDRELVLSAGLHYTKFNA